MAGVKDLEPKAGAVAEGFHLSAEGPGGAAAGPRAGMHDEGLRPRGGAKGPARGFEAVKGVPKYRGNRCRSVGKRAKVIPRSIRVGSQVRVEQRAWLQPGGCALMGCRCPISDGQGWAKAQPGHARTGTKENKILRRILDIMARESYLIQGTIYSNRQTIVSYYNGHGL